MKTVLIDKSLDRETWGRDYIIDRVIGHINKSKKCQSYILIHKPETDDEKEEIIEEENEEVEEDEEIEEDEDSLDEESIKIEEKYIKTVLINDNALLIYTENEYDNK